MPGKVSNGWRSLTPNGHLPEEPPPAMLLACDDRTVKQEAAALARRATGAMTAAVDEGASVRELEKLSLEFVHELGSLLLSAALARKCARATEADLQARGLNEDQFSLRMERDYWATLSTTLGPVSFPWFAYRDRSVGAGTVTRTPARQAVLPLWKRCRSSELLLEFESRLGSDHPFRHAEQALTFFTHGAVRLEDTTIARHMVTVGNLVDRSWTYRTAESIASILLRRATRDPETDRPLLYASTDAHALRTYVDETWDAQWKMANGIRLWCIDRRSGATIHLGGEYTWGDCEQVEAVFKWLRDTGRMPAGGQFADGLNTQLVLITDGALWIKERVLPLFPTAVPLLDAYHLMEEFAKYSRTRHPGSPYAAQRLYQRMLDALYGPSRSKDGKPPKKRAGHKKSRDRSPVPTKPADDAPHAKVRGRAPATDRLIELLHDDEELPDGLEEEQQRLIKAIKNNARRIDYERWRCRGYQIGSGAMESLHRTASQMRLKVAGIRCLPETSQAVFNLRMLRLCERWDEFWSDPSLTLRLVDAFETPHAGDFDDRQEAA